MSRTLLIVIVAVGLAAPASAKKAKRHVPHKAPASVAVKGDVDKAVLPPKTNAATDYEKAKAELDDLQSSREIPLATLDNQASDSENPLKKR